MVFVVLAVVVHSFWAGVYCAGCCFFEVLAVAVQSVFEDGVCCAGCGSALCFEVVLDAAVHTGCAGCGSVLPSVSWCWLQLY